MALAPHRSPRWRRFIARHLFAYLAVLAGVVVAISVVFARDELSAALGRFDLRLIPAVLGLSLFNYGLRFLKWERLLRDSGVEIPRAANLRLYFACFAMVVTPARLGELYKLVFLRRLHGIAAARSLPALVVERATDAMAILLLIVVQPFHGLTGVIAVAGGYVAMVGAVGWLASPKWEVRRRAVLGHLPLVRGRVDQADRLVTAHATLLQPRSLASSLGLSTISWWAECVGLWWILVGLGEAFPLVDATWIYALSTALGNVTFLPGGLGGTEVSLVGLLRNGGAGAETALAATALVRGATLWFAVAIGLGVTLVFRRALQWDSVTREAADES